MNQQVYDLTQKDRKPKALPMELAANFVLNQKKCSFIQTDLHGTITDIEPNDDDMYLEIGCIKAKGRRQCIWMSLGEMGHDD
jgi:hypothetical protein